MCIDLQKCVGCQTCTAVCKQMNQVPFGTMWQRVIGFQHGVNPDEPQRFLPLSCLHCAHAPCLEVCPTTATYQRPDGIVDIHHDLCVGCGYCVVACPYAARTVTGHGEPVVLVAENYVPGAGMTNGELAGVCTKCDFCLPRVTTGLEKGLRPGVDREASPACLSFCLSGAISFGDLNDPDDPISRLIRNDGAVRLHEELGTDPATYYLLGNSADVANGSSDIEIVPAKQQTAWGWPAVGNFLLGGMGAGLYLLGALVPAQFEVLGPVLACVGFAILMLEAGRPARSRYLLRALRRSWISRETLAGAVFIAAGIADWFWHGAGLGIAAVIGAAGLIVSQGFILRRARGVTAWNVAIMPLLFVTSAFATGSGLMLLLSTPGRETAAIALASAVLNLAVWLAYLYGSRDPAFRKATATLRGRASLLFVAGLGHALPALLLVPVAMGLREHAGLAVALAGASMIFGGLLQKAAIIFKAGYLRAIVLRPPRRSEVGA